MILGWPPTAADKHAEQERQTAKDFRWCRCRHIWNSIHRVLNEGNVMWPTAGWGAATLFVCKQIEWEKKDTHYKLIDYAASGEAKQIEMPNHEFPGTHSRDFPFS